MKIVREVRPYTRNWPFDSLSEASPVRHATGAAADVPSAIEQFT